MAKLGHGNKTFNNKQSFHQNSAKGIPKYEDQRVTRSQQSNDKIRKKEKHFQGKKTDKVFQDYLLNEFGLEIVEMAGDGNCLFRSIAHQLENNPSLHMKYRQEVTRYIASKRKHFELFLEDDELFDDYIARMRVFGTWGGHPELYAASQLYKINIAVYQWQAPKYVINFDPSIHEDRSGIASNEKSIRTIKLSFHGECHFNSIISAGPVPSYEHQSSNLNDNNIIHDSACANSTNILVNAVGNAIPWGKNADIIAALRENNNHVDDAIEYLCKNMDNLNHDDDNNNQNESDNNKIVETELNSEDMPPKLSVVCETSIQAPTDEEEPIPVELLDSSPKVSEDEWTEVKRKPKKPTDNKKMETLSKKVLNLRFFF